ncbi:MAG: AbrB/MazE/SpoVT family DNA-binding domain-containing protein, partial [Nanoarchaeota archaeon]|nr:AbrB/MazE/SpoVT family DNA-binding domain-containing protein [Nanoarchaeota archaeon]
MHKRKIQLIAGTTYTVSLPKEWVRKNNLKEKNEILLHEKNDRTLIISPHSIEGKKLNEISLNIDEYAPNIDQILFAVYYLGIENITLFSKKEITKDVKVKIRKTITHMSGTEIG